MLFLEESLILLVLTLIVVTLTKSAIFQQFMPARSKKESKHLDDPVSSSLYRGQATYEEPYRLPPLKIGASTQMTMGLRPFDCFNWLTIDENYILYHKKRSQLLSNQARSVLQCLPGSESACHEVLSVVSSFLASRYPSMFRFSGCGSGRLIHNLRTGESFPVLENPRPLETAARLAMEDFNLLVRDQNGDYRLQASATLFPAGWKLEDRIGYTLVDLHGPVPGWKNKLCSPVNRYFDHLSPSTAMERHTLFVQTSADLYQDECLCSIHGMANCPTTNSTAVLEQTSDENRGRSSDSGRFAKEGDSQVSIDASVSKRALLSEIYIRRERQTFTRLPASDAVLFTVRTYMKPLKSLSDEELEAFVEQAGRWGEEMAAYKGRENWWDTVLKYHEERKGIVTQRN